jgi:hypothetical protein
MGHLATQYDEKQFEEDLARLEVLVDEIKKQNKGKEAEAGSGGGQKQGSASHASVA